MQFISQLLIERNANSPVNRLKQAFLPEALLIKCIKFAWRKKLILFYFLFLVNIFFYLPISITFPFIFFFVHRQRKRMLLLISC